MNTNWIIYGLLLLAFLVIMNFVGPLKGTTNSDFPAEHQPRDSNPLPACSDSPNCVRLSVPFEADSTTLMTSCITVLEEMGAETIDSDSQTLQIDAVFQIALFGFRDDFSVRLSDDDTTGETILHLSSSSCDGQSDLGVNRRRVNEFLKSVQAEN
jgi:uncharacterized protein (DUF1499 family)